MAVEKQTKITATCDRCGTNAEGQETDYDDDPWPPDHWYTLKFTLSLVGEGAGAHDRNRVDTCLCQPCAEVVSERLHYLLLP